MCLRIINQHLFIFLILTLSPKHIFNYLTSSYVKLNKVYIVFIEFLLKIYNVSSENYKFSKSDGVLTFLMLVEQMYFDQSLFVRSPV